MKRFIVFFIVLTFVTFPLQAKAYLSEEWTKECGYISYNEGYFFLHGLRLYSQKNWREIFDYIGENMCVEGFFEKKEGRNIGISYHFISAFEKSEEIIPVQEIIPEFHESAPVEYVGTSPGLQTYYGFLTQGNGNRTYLSLDNGQNILLLKTFWENSFAGPKFFVEGQVIIRDGVIRSIKEPGIYTNEEYKKLPFAK